MPGIDRDGCIRSLETRVLRYHSFETSKQSEETIVELLGRSKILDRDLDMIDGVFCHPVASIACT